MKNADDLEARLDLAPEDLSGWLELAVLQNAARQYGEALAAALAADGDRALWEETRARMEVPKPGDMVKVRAFGGRIMERRVVKAYGGMVYVCRDEEYQAAQREERKPVCIGFSLADIVGETEGKV